MQLFALTGWFGSLSLTEAIFYALGIVASLAVLVLAVLTLLGWDGAHADLDADAGDGFGIFSVKTITGFFLAFGWSGALLTQQGLSLFWTLAGATLSGFIMMAVIALVLRSTRRMQADGTIQVGNSVGRVATVYVTIPPAGQGAGQITVPFGGRTLTMAALQSGSRPLAAGDKVRIAEVIDSSTARVDPLA